MAKNRPSSVDMMPDDIRDQLQALLRDPRVTQLEATARINAILEEEGHPKISKSAVNRYAVKMDEVGKRLRQSREVAGMWINRLGAEPQGKVGHLLNEMVRTLAFEAVLDFSEGDDKASPKMIKDLATAIHRLERASSENVKREEEIRRKALADAADQVAKVAKHGGMSAATVQQIRTEILGISQ
ncbi:MAG: DUF3486 family protein [Thermodesulfobacteriota bacterium]